MLVAKRQVVRYFLTTLLHEARHSLSRQKNSLSVVGGRFTAHMVSAVTDVKGTYLPPLRLVRGFLI